MMKTIKTALLLVMAMMLTASGLGCGLGSTAQENGQRFNRVADHDARMLVDDLMLFSQTNRPLRTSRWIVN